jgi:hypothetical protein
MALRSSFKDAETMLESLDALTSPSLDASEIRSNFDRLLACLAKDVVSASHDLISYGLCEAASVALHDKDCSALSIGYTRLISRMSVTDELADILTSRITFPLLSGIVESATSMEIAASLAVATDLARTPACLQRLHDFGYRAAPLATILDRYSSDCSVLASLAAFFLNAQKLLPDKANTVFAANLFSVLASATKQAPDDEALAVRALLMSLTPAAYGSGTYPTMLELRSQVIRCPRAQTDGLIHVDGCALEPSHFAARLSNLSFALAVKHASWFIYAPNSTICRSGGRFATESDFDNFFFMRALSFVRREDCPDKYNIVASALKRRPIGNGLAYAEALLACLDVMALPLVPSFGYTEEQSQEMHRRQALPLYELLELLDVSALPPAAALALAQLLETFTRDPQHHDMVLSSGYVHHLTALFRAHPADSGIVACVAAALVNLVLPPLRPPPPPDLAFDTSRYRAAEESVARQPAPAPESAATLLRSGVPEVLLAVFSAPPDDRALATSVLRALCALPLTKQHWARLQARPGAGAAMVRFVATARLDAPLAESGWSVACVMFFDDARAFIAETLQALSAAATEAAAHPAAADAQLSQHQPKAKELHDVAALERQCAAVCAVSNSARGRRALLAAGAPTVLVEGSRRRGRTARQHARAARGHQRGAPGTFAAVKRSRARRRARHCAQARGAGGCSLSR